MGISGWRQVRDVKNEFINDDPESGEGGDCGNSISLQQFLHNALVDHLLCLYLLGVLDEAVLNEFAHCLHPTPLLLPQRHLYLQFYLWNSGGRMQTTQQSSPARSTPALYASLQLSKHLLVRDSIFKRLDLHAEGACADKDRESQLYQRLQQRMQKAEAQHKLQMLALEEKIAAATMQAQQGKSVLQQKKLCLWELKNEVMQLQDVLQQEEEEMEGEEYCEEQEQDEEYRQGECQEGQEEEQARYADQQQEQGDEQGDSSVPVNLQQLLSGWGPAQ